MKLFRYLSVAAVLLLAAYLRCRDVGLSPLGADDAIISLKAIDVARHGQPTLLGTVMSVGFWHSPFSIYLYALPYTLSADPRIARLFTGLFNVIGLALVYYIGAKFLSRPAGLVGILLVAVHSEMVYWGSGIWNPNVGAPFVLAYLALGLRGYYLNHSLSRWLHPLALSLAAQCHPAAAFLSPITLILFVWAWLQRPAARVRLIWQALGSGGLAALSLLPWGLGLFLAAQNGGSQAEIGLVTGRGADYMFQVLYESLGNWRAHFFQPVLPALVVVGAVWLAFRAIRRSDALPGLVLALSFFLIPLLSLALNAKFRNHFLASAYPNALLIVAALIGGLRSGPALSGRLAWLWNWRGWFPTRHLGWLGLPLVSYIVGLHLVYNFIPPESYLGPRYSLDEQIAAVNAAAGLAAETGRDLLLIANDTGSEPPYAWELLNEGRPARVIWHLRPLPIASNGAVLVGFAADESRPGIFAGGQLLGQYFRLTEVSADQFQLDWPALEPIRFANGTIILGFLANPANAQPLASQAWQLYLLARVEARNPIDQTFFVHLVNANGDKYAQVDLAALPAGQQQLDEVMLAQFDFQIGDGLPVDGPLFLRFGMYGPEGQAQVIDTSGNPAGDFGLIQIRGQSQPLVPMESGLSLNDLNAPAQLLQGPPLTVTANWQVVENIPRDLQVSWRLRSDSDRIVFEQNFEIAPGLTVESLPAGAWLTESYRLRLPTALPAGQYRLEAALLDSDNRPLWPEWYVYPQPVEIQLRQRQFEIPPLTQPVAAIYGDQITLLGYDLNQADKAVQLMLYWQPLLDIEHDYQYFVHVWQHDQLVAQVDSAPGQYQYLTSWWTTGEVIAEPVALDLNALPGGDYVLTTGFYDPITTERLAVTLADNSQPAESWVTLQTIHLP